MFRTILDSGVLGSDKFSQKRFKKKKSTIDCMSSFGLIEKNIELSCTYGAVKKYFLRPSVIGRSLSFKSMLYLLNAELWKNLWMDFDLQDMNYEMDTL